MIFEKPPLDEALLEHHGIKGMHWGVRKKSISGDHSKLKRNAKIVGAGALVLGGAAAAAYVLSKNGSKSTSTVDLTPGITKLVRKDKHGTSTYGSEAVKAFDEHVWKTSASSLGPGYLQGKAVQKHLPDHMFMRWDEKTKGYVQDAVFGYNPNNGKFGRQIFN